jgi:hypothetical protein
VPIILVRNRIQMAASQVDPEFHHLAYKIKMFKMFQIV